MLEENSRLRDLDRIDRNILNELQKDGRISNVELSKRVGLSPTPCLERVRRLERQGFIEGYTAILNPHFLDASLLVFVEITLNRGAPDVFEQFNKAVQTLEEIQVQKPAQIQHTISINSGVRIIRIIMASAAIQPINVPTIRNIPR